LHENGCFALQAFFSGKTRVAGEVGTKNKEFGAAIYSEWGCFEAGKGKK
jgi:hypothetical protein